MHYVILAEEATAAPSDLDPSGRFVFMPHIRPDTIFQFAFDASKGRPSANEPPLLTTPMGTGPRHLVFHPSRPVAYVANEQGDSVTVYALDRRAGTLRALNSDASDPQGWSV